MSLSDSFHLRQFCSPILGFLRLVPGFVEFDQGLDRFLRVRMSVTEFEAAALDGFDRAPRLAQDRSNPKHIFHTQE
jgi:hypothetical protein